MSPFAEAPEPGAAWQIIVAGIAGGVLTKAADYLVQWRKDSRSARREDDADAIGRMEKLLDRVERQLAESERSNKKWQDIASRATVRAERAVVWIKHLESTLRANRITFEPWVDADSTTAFRPAGASEVETDVGPDGAGV